MSKEWDDLTRLQIDGERLLLYKEYDSTQYLEIWSDIWRLLDDGIKVKIIVKEVV